MRSSFLLPSRFQSESRCPAAGFATRRSSLEAGRTRSAGKVWQNEERQSEQMESKCQVRTVSERIESGA